MVQQKSELSLQTRFDPPGGLQWRVREDDQIQEELNRLKESPEHLTSGLVNRVVERIKEL